MPTITKGPIGAQDLYNYDGVNDSFSRLTSDGYTLTLQPVGQYVDVIMVYGGGVNYTNATITLALTAIGTTNKRTLIFRPGTWTVSANVDWSAYTNVTFKFLPGAVLSHGAFTINIPNIDAGLQQVFSGTGAVTLSGYHKEIYPEWWGALPDDSTDNSSAFALAIAALQTYGKLKIGSGIYRGYLAAQKSNITIQGTGIGNTIIKLPDRAIDYTSYKQSIVIEVGDMNEDGGGSGLGPFYRINIEDLTVDGNYLNVPAPPALPPDGVGQDFYGWGVAYTRVADSRIKVHAQNTHNGGIGNMILSDRNKIDTSSYNTGKGLGYAGLEIHSSNFCQVRHISHDDLYGFRMLANSHGNIVDAVVDGASSHGVIISANGTVATQYLYQNIFNVTVNGGCPNGGIVVTGNVWSCLINGSVYNLTGNGFVALDDGAAYMPRQLTLNINSYYGDLCAFYSDAIEKSFITINSYLDGKAGAIAAYYFAIDLTGNRNKINAIITDDSPTVHYLRGIAIRATSEDNEIVSIDTNVAADLLLDNGTRTKCNHGSGFGEDIASEALGTIYIPFYGDIFTVTGTLSTVNIAAGVPNNGRTIKLLFSDTAAAAGLVDGGNLKLAGDLAFSPDDTITLICDGVSWIEVSRSVN
jgi:hypothetical protein